MIFQVFQKMQLKDFCNLTLGLFGAKQPFPTTSITQILWSIFCWFRETAGDKNTRPFFLPSRSLRCILFRQIFASRISTARQFHGYLLYREFILFPRKINTISISTALCNKESLCVRNQSHVKLFQDLIDTGL